MLRNVFVVRFVFQVTLNESEVGAVLHYIKLVLSLTHPPVDDSLSVQEKQTDSNLGGIKPEKCDGNGNINTHPHKRKPVRGVILLNTKKAIHKNTLY